MEETWHSASEFIACVPAPFQVVASEVAKVVWDKMSHKAKIETVGTLFYTFFGGSVLLQSNLYYGLLLHSNETPLIFTVLTGIMYAIIDWAIIEVFIQFLTKSRNRGVIVNNYVLKKGACKLTIGWNAGAMIGQRFYESSLWEVMIGSSTLMYNQHSDYYYQNQEVLDEMTNLVASDKDKNLD